MAVPREDRVTRKAGMGSDAPLFSVVIPTLGRPSLARALSSVLNQTDPDFEVIVVNNGDKSHTVAILGSFRDARLRLFEQPSKGVSAARNRGITEARGTWVTFLDDDDRARPEWLATWRSALGHDAQALTAEVGYVRPGDTPRPAACSLDVADPTMRASTLLAGGFALRRSTLVKAGGFDEDLQYFENYDLGLRLCDILAGMPMAVRHIARVLVEITAAPPRTRALHYGTETGRSAVRVLSKHPKRSASDPHTTAAFLRIASRSAREGGDVRQAIGRSLKAIILDPANHKNWRSLLAATLTPMMIVPKTVRMRLWPRYQHRRPNRG